MRRPHGFVVFLSGRAGVGKTTLGDALAVALKATHIDFDVATRRIDSDFQELNPHLSAPQALEMFKPVRYFLLKREVRSAARRRRIVIVSAPLTGQISSEMSWNTWSESMPLSSLFWLHMPEDERLERLARRGLARDINAQAVEPKTPAVKHSPLDAMSSLGEMVSRVKRVLGRLAF